MPANGAGRDHERVTIPIRNPGKHVVVVGGGVAGLSVAWRLLGDAGLAAATPTAPRADDLAEGNAARVREDLRVTLLEHRDRLGGNIRCERDRGFIVEWGPNGFLDNAPETPRLCRRLGLEPRLLPANDAAGRRFLFVRGKLRPLPMSPAAFLASPILSLRGRLRVLGEPFVPARPDPAESVFSFAARRIGPEAARILVDAMVSGVYGGDSRQLSLLSAFPKMHALERDYGGLVRGMIGKMKESRRERKRTGEKGRAAGPAGPGGVPTSFDQGFEVLIEELASALQKSGRCAIRLEASADRVEPSPAPSPPPSPASAGLPASPLGSPPGSVRWSVTLGSGERLEADAVVLALPSRHARALTRDFDPDLAGELGAIPDAPLVVVGLGFRREDLPAPIDGFGFLVPRGQGPRSLGVLWDSCIYPNRAPHGRVLLRAMVGGAQDPEARDLTDDQVLALVRNDLARTMGLRARPDPVWIFRHPHGIPQYDLSHPDRLQRIDRRLAGWPGLHAAGNSYRGISVNHCVEESIPVARQVLRGLAGLPAPGA